MAEFKDGKYYADSKYGIVGDIANWAYNQYKGSTSNKNAGSRIGAYVNNKQTQYNGFLDSKPNYASTNPVNTDTTYAPSAFVLKGNYNSSAPKQTQYNTNKPTTTLKAPSPLIEQSSVDNTQAGFSPINPADYYRDANTSALAGWGDDMSSGLNTAQQPSSIASAYKLGSPSAPWYSMNAGGYTDEQLASMSIEDQIKAKGLSSNLSNFLGNIGSGVSALGGIYDMYSKYQQNQLMKDAYNAQKSELARQVAKDKAFSANINKSGLGTRA